VLLLWYLLRLWLPQAILPLRIVNAKVHSLERILQVLRVGSAPPVIARVRWRPHAVSDRAGWGLILQFFGADQATVLISLKRKHRRTPLETLADAAVRPVALGERLVAFEIGTTFGRSSPFVEHLERWKCCR